MVPCVCCGAIYSDEEADQITYENDSPRIFTREQLDYIRRAEEETE